MNTNDEDKLLTDLYRQANQEQPPVALDDLILKHAQQSNQKKTDIQSKSSWRLWVAAASVVLVIPMIWLLTQNQQLSEDMGPLTSSDAHPKKTMDATPKAEPSMADDAGMVDKPSRQPARTEKDTEREEKLTVTGSRIVQSDPESPAPAPMANLQEMIEQQGQQSITGRPIDQDSLQANKELLMDEFKSKKRTIKPSSMEPLMLLEYEQFARYLEQGEIEAADQLLTQMQENWPDYDFEDMIYRLVEAELDQQ